MKAVRLSKVGNIENLELTDVPVPQPDRGEVRVRLKASALNHRDLWIVQGLYAKIKLPVTLGSDGAGVVDEVGKDVDRDWLGKEVVINPSLHWGKDLKAQQSGFRILGMPDDGTQAEFTIIPAANIFPKPVHLSFEEAAALPLGGVTGFRALFTQGYLQKGESVLLTGIGGGVAALMLVMALAADARVFVTSGSDNKIKAAMEIGAQGGVNYRRDHWPRALEKMAGSSQIDLVVDSAGGDGFLHLIELVKPGGRIVNFGATAGNPIRLNLRRIFWKQIAIQGTTMGSPTDFYNMLQFFESHKIGPVIDSVAELADFRKVYNRMLEGTHFGKLVLKNS
ncbi:MAG: alcohol dehydrogenase [Calditrichaeota bacterium]|nr:zinc-binding dehydrogenase [Calditrichota bacterium]RQV99229.1 MAG: alcohol dehydrogenase [Calditrichota bacterium]